MRNNNFLLLVFLLPICFTSCIKDDLVLDPDGEIAAISRALPGDWFVSKGGHVTFNTDYTGSTDTDIFDAHMDGQQITEFTWEVDDDKMELILNYGLYHNGTYRSSSTAVKVKESKTRKIKMEIYSVDVLLTR